ILLDGYTPLNDTQYARISGLSAAISFRLSSVAHAKLWSGFSFFAINVFGDGDPQKRRVTVNQQPMVTVQNLNLDGGMTATLAPGLKLLGSTVGATTTLSGCTNAQLTGNTLKDLVLTDNTTDTAVTNNFI